MRNWIRLILPIIITSCVMSADAQRWTVVPEASVRSLGRRDIVPQMFVLYKTDDDETKKILWSAPEESDQALRGSKALLTVGLPDGTLDTFRMVRYEMMEPGLETDYPDIRTFRGESVTVPNRTIRADWTESGLRAVMRDDNGMMYIDHYQRNDIEHRISYYRKDLLRSTDWACDFKEEPGDHHETGNQRAGDCTFRSYRLAQAADAEYSIFFGATSSAQSGLVMSAVVTAINRVNEVYEADATIRLILIANTNLLFYYDTLTDPYSNFSGGAMLTQNQSNITSVIGSANYDIGHVFSTGGGGVAQLGCVCSSGSKSRGVTGNGSPVGDSFTIDYVAHEMGHQFGANHTFNSIASFCNGNRSTNSAYEVGSGTTVMAYAGICGVDDVQPHSDAYFHARSLLEIGNYVTTGGGASCAAIITLNNTPPIVVAVPDYTIPKSTPFVLTGNASDPNGDPLKYCWEEYDLESTSTEPPTSDDTNGPMFRSFSPTASPKRYFPRLQDIVANATPMWEVLPSVARTMNYRLTVRDYHNIAGCTKEDNIVVTTNASAGPFLVTSDNSTSTWYQGLTRNVTWDVANTTASPVNCPNVDIFLSYDGGLTYPTTLLANEPNDGIATITVPNGTTTTGRFMVKGSNNIFFDINNANFNIQIPVPDFTISLNPANVGACNNGTGQTTINVGQLFGFSNPVTLTALNLPIGAIATFNPQVVSPGASSILTISNLGSLSGTYTPTIRGTSTTGNKDVALTFSVYTAIPGSTTLLSPANNTSNSTLTPLLDWSPVNQTGQYEYQISTDNAFELMVLSGASSQDFFQVTSGLSIGRNYFWRVRSVNGCGSGPWTPIFSFTTSGCFALMSPNVPVTIPSTGAQTVTSILTALIPLNITDLNIVSLVGTHTYMDDLQFTLIAPNATQVLFWNRPCTSEDNFNINFDDEAANNSWPCPPTNGLTYKPDLPLTSFDGLVSNGNWTMKIQDLFDQDGGALNTWGLNVCGTSTCQLTVNQINGSGVGSLASALNCANNGDSIKISAALASQTIDIGANPLTINKHVIIIALGANTQISTSGARVFEIPNTTTYAQVSNLTLKSGTSLTGAAINNAGILTLKNVNILKNVSVPGASLIQELPGSQLSLIGTCNVQ